MKNARSLRILMIMCILCFVFFGCTPAAPPAPAPGSDAPPAPAPQNQDGGGTSAAEHSLLDKDAKENTTLLPRGFSETSEYVVDAARAEIVMYYAAASSVFSYADKEKTVVDDALWAQRLYKEYGIKLHFLRKAPETSLAAQRVALLADAKIDILSFTPDQLPYAEGMAADLSLLLPDGAEYLNTSLYAKGKKYLMPAGVARSLWYVPGDKEDPLALARRNAWTVDALDGFLENRQSGVKGLEIGEISELLAAAGRPLLKISGNTVTAAAQDETILALRGILTRPDAHVSGEEDNMPSLSDGKLMMRYGVIPYWNGGGKRPAIRFAPLPTAEEKQAGGVVASASVLALPKNGKHTQSALAAAMLFTARFADARHDTLRFGYGMSFEDWSEYFAYCNEHLCVAAQPDSASAEKLLALVSDSSLTDVKGELAALNASVAAYAARRNARAAL